MGRPYYMSNYIELVQLVKKFVEFLRLELEKANKLVPTSPNSDMDGDQVSEMDTLDRRKRDLSSSSLNQTGIIKEKSRVKRSMKARQEFCLCNPSLRYTWSQT